MLSITSCYQHFVITLFQFYNKCFVNFLYYSIRAVYWIHVKVATFWYHIMNAIWWKCAIICEQRLKMHFSSLRIKRWPHHTNNSSLLIIFGLRHYMLSSFFCVDIHFNRIISTTKSIQRKQLVFFLQLIWKILCCFFSKYKLISIIYIWANLMTL